MDVDALAEKRGVKCCMIFLRSGMFESCCSLWRVSDPSCLTSCFRSVVKRACREHGDADADKPPVFGKRFYSRATAALPMHTGVSRVTGGNWKTSVRLRLAARGNNSQESSRIVGGMKATSGE